MGVDVTGNRNMLEDLPFGGRATLSSIAADFEWLAAVARDAEALDIRATVLRGSGGYALVFEVEHDGAERCVLKVPWVPPVHEDVDPDILTRNGPNQVCVRSVTGPFVLQPPGTVEDAERLLDAACARQMDTGCQHPLPRLIDRPLLGGIRCALYEDVAGPSLRWLIRWRPEEARTLVGALAKALLALHESFGAHGDLKPEHVIREQRSGEVVLIDPLCDAMHVGSIGYTLGRPLLDLEREAHLLARATTSQVAELRQQISERAKLIDLAALTVIIAEMWGGDPGWDRRLAYCIANRGNGRFGGAINWDDLRRKLERALWDVPRPLRTWARSVGTRYLDALEHPSEELPPSRCRDRLRELIDAAIAVEPESTLDTRIAEIDRLLSMQLDEILHHPEFQRLEASWRGLRYLVLQSETGPMLRIRVLNVSKKELLHEMQRATAFDRSAIFEKVYADVYAQIGEPPFGALVGDYEFGTTPEDIELLQKLAQVAAASHAPFLSAASHEMFDRKSHTRLAAQADLPGAFTNSEYARWSNLRDSEESRFIGLTVPRVLMREPYGPDSVPAETFNYNEKVDGAGAGTYLWGSAAYALGLRITHAFARYGWCAAIRGAESGGRVEGLPVHTFRTESGDVGMMGPTEVLIPERSERELVNLGFIPLVRQAGSRSVVFFSVPSLQRTPVYVSDTASANARMAAELTHVLVLSRFAHYLKVIARDRVGGLPSRAEAEKVLNNWINGYVVLADVNPMAKATRPLRSARIEVLDVPGRPGAYRAVAYIKPRFQLDETATGMRVIVDLPLPGAR